MIRGGLHLRANVMQLVLMHCDWLLWLRPRVRVGNNGRDAHNLYHARLNNVHIVFLSACRHVK